MESMSGFLPVCNEIVRCADLALPPVEIYDFSTCLALAPGEFCYLTGLFKPKFRRNPNLFPEKQVCCFIKSCSCAPGTKENDANNPPTLYYCPANNIDPAQEPVALTGPPLCSNLKPCANLDLGPTYDQFLSITPCHDNRHAN